jgi:methyl halide transferase
VGYDLTFLCALHPSMREAWAAGWARVLRPGGRLITACFPIDASRDQNAGPPWPLTPELYERLLLGAQGGGGEGGGGAASAAPFRKVWLAPVPPGMSHPDRAGQEWLGIWERV